MITIEQLVTYIKNHGVEAWSANGKLFAVDRGSLNGQPVEAVVEIEPTSRAVREWLGY